jgi:hypothetical protein
MTEAGSASGPFQEIEALLTGTGPKCNAGPFIASLSDEDRAAIDLALERKLALTAIGKFCQKRGFRFTDQAVVRHLSKRCSCPRQ